MKKTIAILCCIALIFTFFNVQRANADGLTIALVAGTAYLLASYSGLNIVFGAGSTAASAQSAMQNSLTSYIGNSTLVDKFGTEAARLVAGKLVVGHTLFNGIKEFFNWLIDSKNLESGQNTIFPSEIEGIPLDDIIGFSDSGRGLRTQCRTSGNAIAFETYYGNSQKIHHYYSAPSAQDIATGIGWTIRDYVNDTLYVTYVYSIKKAYTHEVITYTVNESGLIRELNVSSSATGDISGGYSDTELTQSQYWEGNVEGYVGPDTNIDQLMGDIFAGAANNDINIEGEIVDPAPAPTPRPTTPPATDVLGGINDLIGQQDQVLEGIDTITGDVAQTAEAAQEAAEAAQEAAEALQEGLDIVSAQDAPTYKFDLSTLFPFCIPFDIVRMLQAFDGIAEAPHVQIPFVIQSMNFSYLIDLDFSSFSPVAAVLRQVELIAFGIALAYATSKVIRW